MVRLQEHGAVGASGASGMIAQNRVGWESKFVDDNVLLEVTAHRVKTMTLKTVIVKLGNALKKVSELNKKHCHLGRIWLQRNYFADNSINSIIYQEIKEHLFERL